MGLSSKLASTVSDYSNDKSLGFRLRAKRIQPLIEIAENVYREKGRVSILDIGGSKRYWNIVPESIFDELNISVTVVNKPGDSQPQEESERFSFEYGDGCNLRFEDNSFDIFHSNSVIEQVGDWQLVKQFVNETRMLAPNYFVQTPYRYFAIEPHFMFPYFQLLPLSWRGWLLTKMNLGHHKKQPDMEPGKREALTACLLNMRMIKELFPEADILRERFFLATKPLVALKSFSYS